MNNLLHKYIPLSLSVVILATLGLFWLNTPKAQASFAFSKSITIQSGKVPSTQTNFPMVVSGTFNGTGSDPDLRTVGNGGGVQNSNGYDIGFYSNSNCSTGKLDWQTELWTAATGVSAYWVEVPSILTGAVIYICYGDSSIVTDQSNPTGVWDANFTGVWHLSDNAASATVSDSVSGGHNGTNTVNTSGVTATGQIGKALTYSGEYTNMGNVLNTSWGSGVNFTLDIWFNANSTGGNKLGMITKTGNGVPGPLFALRFGSLYYEGYDGTNNPFGFSSGASTGTWTHVVYTRVTGTTTGTFYFNGVAVTTITDNTGDMGSASDVFHLGGDTANGALFDGILDEARVSNVARSADWIATEYNNESSPSTFYAFANNPQTIATGQSGSVNVLQAGMTILNGGVIIK